MEVSEFIGEMKEVNEKLLNYIDSQDDESAYQEFLTIIKQKNIQDDVYTLRQLLQTLSIISVHHHRTSSLYDKVEKIIKYFLTSIKNNFKNDEIFTIFKRSKLLLLFLIKEGIIEINNNISQIMNDKPFKQAQYTQYFYPELKTFLYNPSSNVFEKGNKNSKDFLTDENFEENRQRGENNRQICQIIQKDDIDEFIVHVNQNNISLESTIKPSVYDTNSILMTEKVSLIQYAAFYGSIQIFKYLNLNGIELTSSLWTYVIHSNNAEMIQILTDKNIPIDIDSKNNSIEEAIKCHHNEMANYLLDNFVSEENKNSLNINKYGIKYHNFMFIEPKKLNQESFLKLCKYDHFALMNLLLLTPNIDINYVYI